MSPHDCMQYPQDTLASDWGPFWAFTREVVFDLLSGLKGCFPQSPTPGARMDGCQWSRWVYDMLWTLHQLIRM